MMEHTVTAFDDDLKFITRKVVEMGGHAESMIARAIAALVKGDKALAESIAQRVKAFPGVDQVTVTVHKPYAPVTEVFEDVIVRITR